MFVKNFRTSPLPALDGNPKEIMTCLKNRVWFHPIELNVNTIVHNFYALITLEAWMKPDMTKHSHERLVQDFVDYLNWYCEIVAKIFYDYTALVLFGEMRHCSRYADAQFDDPLFPDASANRTECYLNPGNYTENGIYFGAMKIFNPEIVHWKESGYGGEAWYKIARTWYMYNNPSIPKKTYVDTIVDTEHNNGCFFDKGAGMLFMPDNLTRFLDKKNDTSVSPSFFWERATSEEVQKLILKAYNLEMIELPSNFKFLNEDYSGEFTARISPNIFSDTHYCNLYYKENNGAKSIQGIKNWDLETFLMNYHSPNFGDVDLSLVPLNDKWGEPYNPRAYRKCTYPGSTENERRDRDSFDYQDYAY